MSREEIDEQFPYIQVDRRVAAHAAKLSTALEITYQHARGALDIFWEGFVTRTELLKAIKLELEGRGPARILVSKADVEVRLLLAFGRKVDPALLVSCRLLELEGDLFRICGASRYIGPEWGRLFKKGAMPKRAEKTPSPTPSKGKPPSPTPPRLDLETAPEPPRSPVHATPVAPGSDPGATGDTTPVEPGMQPRSDRGYDPHPTGETADGRRQTADFIKPPPNPPPSNRPRLVHPTPVEPTREEEVGQPEGEGSDDAPPPAAQSEKLDGPPSEELDLEPLEAPLTWAELIGLWAHTRIAAGLNVEDVADFVEKLFAEDLPKYTRLQWAGCLERYVDPRESRGLSAAGKKWPLRMLVGNVRYDRMPEREKRGRVCHPCKRPAETLGPSGRPLCEQCRAEWRDAFRAAVPIVELPMLRPSQNPDITDEEIREMNLENLERNRRAREERERSEPAYFARWVQVREGRSTAAV